MNTDDLMDFLGAKEVDHSALQREPVHAMTREEVASELLRGQDADAGAAPEALPPKPPRPDRPSEGGKEEKEEEAEEKRSPTQAPARCPHARTRGLSALCLIAIVALLIWLSRRSSRTAGDAAAQEEMIIPLPSIGRGTMC